MCAAALFLLFFAQSPVPAMREPDDTVFHGWFRPGPRPPGGVLPGDGETLDYLAGHYKIFQYQRGHRYSVDDALTAFYGSSCAPRVERALDLGSGIGSVALFVAWRLPGAQIVTLEAQERSLALAKKSVRYNGLEERFTLLRGDLRDDAALLGHGTFDLVTGTPPYWPLGERKQAAHPQAVPARLEVRGDASDYAKAAARALAPGGVYAFCLPNDQPGKATAAIDDAGLVLLRRRDAIFKEEEPYGITLYLCARARDLPAELAQGAITEPPLLLRTREGAFGAEYARVRLCYGFPPGALTARTHRSERS